MNGFGLKTQETLIKSLNYFLDSKGKFLFSQAIGHATDLIEKLQSMYPNEMFSMVGDIAKKNIIVDSIDILHTISIDEKLILKLCLENEDNL